MARKEGFVASVWETEEDVLEDMKSMATYKYDEEPAPMPDTLLNYYKNLEKNKDESVRQNTGLALKELNNFKSSKTVRQNTGLSVKELNNFQSEKDEDSSSSDNIKVKEYSELSPGKNLPPQSKSNICQEKFKCDSEVKLEWRATGITLGQRVERSKTSWFQQEPNSKATENKNQFEVRYIPG